MQIINRHAEKPSLSPSDERRLSNQVLVSRCLNHDRPAWEEFFRRYIPRLKNAIRHTLNRNGFFNLANDMDIIWDIHQLLVKKLYTDLILKECNDLSGLDRWLYTVARNHTLDWLRARNRIRNLPNLIPNESFTDDGPDPLPDRQSQPPSISDNILQQLQDHLIKEGKSLDYWVFRLSLIWYSRLSAAEIDDLSRFTGKDTGAILQYLGKLDTLLHQKQENRTQLLGKAVFYWYQIEYLERQLYQITKTREDTQAMELIRNKIDQKKLLRITCLRKMDKPIRASNHDISQMVGLGPDQENRVTAIIKRMQAMLYDKHKTQTAL